MKSQRFRVVAEGYVAGNEVEEIISYLRRIGFKVKVRKVNDRKRKIGGRNNYIKRKR